MFSSLKDVDVLVTGGNGFIGSHLVRRLASIGARLHLISLNNWNIKGIDGVKFHHTDITDYESVKKSFTEVKPSKIFHLAAEVNLSHELKDAGRIADVKIRGTMNLIRALDGIDYDCFVNTGTCEEYGLNKSPFREDMMPIPITPYSASSAAATLMCKMFHDTNGLPILTLRQFTCYGPGQKSGMLIPYVITSALAGKEIRMTPGEQKRDFNFVEDAVESFLLASVKKSAIGEIINVGTGKSRKVKDVVETILGMMGNPVKPSFDMPYRKPEIWDLVSDSSKAEKILGWKPKTPFESGLKRTIDWYASS